jgi:Phage protein (N4 Gp49/phage Sf6 gene 66) family
MKTTRETITPAIGAAVRFMPAASGDADLQPHSVGEIAHLWSDTCANISFVLPDDRIIVRSSVPLFQPGVSNGCNGYYAELIPPQASSHVDQPAAFHVTSEAPRVTEEEVEGTILREFYFTAADGVQGRFGDAGDAPTDFELIALDMVTMCVLILKNGHRIVGVNEGPVSPANFSAEMGKSIARKNAVEQIWPLMGYELRSALHSEVVRGIELRATDTTTDLRDVVSAMTHSPDAVQHTENPDHGFDDDAIGDRSHGVGEGPAGEIG